MKDGSDVGMVIIDGERHDLHINENLRHIIIYDIALRQLPSQHKCWKDLRDSTRLYENIIILWQQQQLWEILHDIDGIQLNNKDAVHARVSDDDHVGKYLNEEALVNRILCLLIFWWS